MPRENARDELILYRHSAWVAHCRRVLSKLLLPHLPFLLSRSQRDSFDEGDRPWIILMENRINSQWLMTWLNCLLMMPPGTGICFCSDQQGLEEIQAWLQNQPWRLSNLSLLLLQPWLGNVRLGNRVAFNAMMKNPGFWQQLPGERLLIMQTDAVLIEPIPNQFLDYGYLGAPYLPGHLSDVFCERDSEGALRGFFESETFVHSPPHPNTYPFLFGNGGLSVRSRRLMQLIAATHASESPADENEDVFFSTHLAQHSTPAPLQIARAFAMETEYSATAIGCHAPWKYLSAAEQAAVLERHYCEVMACLDYPSTRDEE